MGGGINGYRDPRCSETGVSTRMCLIVAQVGIDQPKVDPDRTHATRVGDRLDGDDELDAIILILMIGGRSEQMLADLLRVLVRVIEGARLWGGTGAVVSTCMLGARAAA